MPASLLSFNQVVKHYGKIATLKDLTFDLKEGEFFGLAGVNGAGKTTLIKCLLDLCAIDSGQITISGIPHTFPTARLPIAFLPERFIPPYYLTGEDFLKYLLGLHQTPFQANQITAMLAELDLEISSLKKPVRNYSKGMTQKLGLAACFLSGKRILILDEPMSGLDPKARALVKALLNKLKKNQYTVFLTSHALVDIEEICDRMAILHNGQIQYIGAPRTLKESYNTTLEQAFLHCINGVKMV